LIAQKKKCSLWGFVSSISVYQRALVLCLGMTSGPARRGWACVTYFFLRCEMLERALKDPNPREIMDGERLNYVFIIL
jgi:hypothetical protein